MVCDPEGPAGKSASRDLRRARSEVGGGTGEAAAEAGQPGVFLVRVPRLAKGLGAVSCGASTRRIGQCWEATRAPRWTRKPQAWAVEAARAGLLRDRQECEKSRGGWGTESLKSFPHQTETETTTSGKSALALSANRRFTLNQYNCGWTKCGHRRMEQFGHGPGNVLGGSHILNGMGLSFVRKTHTYF